MSPLRAAIAAAATLVLLTGAVAAARQSTPKTVDALTLAIAVRAGQAEQYKGFDANCVPADPAKKTEASVPLTLGSVGKDGKTQPVVTLEEFVNYQMVGRPMLMVNLRGRDLTIKPEPDPKNPVLYTFTGVFNGETEQVTPPASIMDNNPKSFTVAIVRDATAK